MSSYPTTGIQATAGQPTGPQAVQGVRREIDEWWSSTQPQDVNQQSLFIYALHEFEAMDPNDFLSYFGVAGIHGQPLKNWDQVSKPNDGNGPGYCTHGQPRFAVWHRPYVLLYEQRLWEIMVNTVIPREFPAITQEMLAAANAWRLPYWDWATAKPTWLGERGSGSGPNVPRIVTLETVTVRTNTGTTTVANPMYKFVLPQTGSTQVNMGVYGITSIDDLRYDLSVATVKHPNTNSLLPTQPGFQANWVNGTKQNWQAVTSDLRGAAGLPNILPEQVYRLFAPSFATLGYPTFASTFFEDRQPVTAYRSLEGIHNNVHAYTGGVGGHMSEVPVAAFDPIFWLHHNNVERLACIYQDLWPTLPGDSTGSAPQDNWLSPSDTVDELEPFHRDTNYTNFYPNDCRDWRQFNYTYPELQQWLPENQVNGQFDVATYRNNIFRRLKSLYPPGTDAIGLDGGEVIPAAPAAPAAAVAQQPLKTPASTAPQERSIPASASKPQSAAAADDDLKAAATTKLHAATVTPQVKLAALPTPSISAAPLSNTAQTQNGNTNHSSSPANSAHNSNGTHASNGTPTPKPLHIRPNPKITNDYVVNVVYEKFALSGLPFTVRIFLGPVPTPPTSTSTSATTPAFPTFAQSPTQIGAVHNFSAPAHLLGPGPPSTSTPAGSGATAAAETPACRNCERQQLTRARSTGQVLLTPWLAHHVRHGGGDGAGGARLASLAPGDVVPYLRENLHWRVTDIHGTLIPKERIPSLRISAARGRATHFPDSDVEPSRYDDYEVLYAVTEGRMCGVGEGEGLY